MIKIMLDKDARMPSRAHEYDAGLDLFAREDFVVPGGYCNAMLCDAECGSAVHDTGVHIEIPDGYVGFIKSKSGLNFKHGITAEGVIDSSYRGTIQIKFYNHTSQAYHFKKGDKITQLVILPVLITDLECVEELDNTERGDGGFGSTGK